MAHAHCILDNYGHRHTLTICNFYFFTTATIITRTRLNVMFIRTLPVIIWCFSDPASYYKLVSNYQLNAQFLYSMTIYTSMLHYNPRHVSSSTMFIFRRKYCIIIASGIVTLCKQPSSMPLSTGILYGRLQRVTIPDTVKIQFVLLKMSMVLLETCSGI